MPKRYLADAFIRHYGAERAAVIAKQYADSCTVAGDQAGRIRWTSVAELIAEEIEKDRTAAEIVNE